MKTTKEQWTVFGLRMFTIACGSAAVHVHVTWVLVLAIMGVAGASYAAGLIDGGKR